MAEVINFQFSVRTDYIENAKVKTKMCVAWVTLRKLQFWDPLYIYGTAKATNFKSGMQIDYEEYFPTGDIETLAAFDMYWYR